MRIAFVTPQMITGGAETYIIRKCEWLNKKGHTCIIISEGGVMTEFIPPFIRHYCINNISFPPFKLTKHKRDIVVNGLSEILLKNNIEIIECHNSFAAIYTALSFDITNIPYIINILSDNALYKNPLLFYLCKKGEKFDLNYVVSTQASRNLNRYFHSNIKFKVLNIPIDSPNYIKSVDSDKYILSVCRMSEEKMYVKHLIEGFTDWKIAKQMPTEIKLFIVGEGKLFNEVKNIADKCNIKIGNNDIHILGTVIGNELDVLFQNCTLYVGMGTTLLIAASYRKSCLLPGFEIKTQPYTWGFWGEKENHYEYLVGDDSLVEYKSSYSNSLAEYFSDPILQKKLGELSYNTFYNHFSTEKIMKEWIGVYESALRKKDNKSRNYKLIKISNDLNILNYMLRFLYKLYKLIKN